MTAEVHGGRLSLVSDTRSELLALAHIVAEDPDRRDGALEIVPLLAADVSAVDHLFDCLTEAVAEQEALHNDPRSYLEARDFPLRSVDRIADSLAGNVEGLLDQLTAGLAS